MRDDEVGRKGAFRGLFVGLDHFESSEIRPLKFAKADATALHALFLDRFGDGAVLLQDAEATKECMTAELAHMAEVCTEDDLVVITYSGHGSSTHELATYDTDPTDLAASALPLTEFVGLVSRIPARSLFIVLDCCFSGAATARVLIPPGAEAAEPRSTRSVEAVLGELTRSGWVVITAATEAQEAREDWRLGHGIFTHYVIDALLGAGDVVEDGRVSVMKLVSYVQRKVTSACSARQRQRQDPTLRGRIDGGMYLPVLQPGRHFRALCDRRRPTPVTEDLNSLAAHGISGEILDVLRQEVPALNSLQISAVNDCGILAGNTVVARAPTAAGKTLVGLLPALCAAQRGERTVFLLPTKALVDELYDRLTESYSPAGVRTIRVTGELTDQLPDLISGKYQFAILTYEKFAHLTFRKPELLTQIAVLVVDEIQTIGHPTRGPLLELLLTLVKVRQVDGVAPQIVALSAVLDGLSDLDSWLGADSLLGTTRPVPLVEGVLDDEGEYRHRDEHGEVQVARLFPINAGGEKTLLSLVGNLVASDEQVIVFRSSRAGACSSAEELARVLDLGPAEGAMEELSAGEPSMLGDRLRHCLRSAVAFHISDLGSNERRVVEQYFRTNDIRVIVATSTLAQGVNLPADSVVLCEVDYLHNAGRTPYLVADYKNMAGRAGRTGLVPRGRAILMSEDRFDARRKWDTYVLGTPERLNSALLAPTAELGDLALFGCAGLQASGRRPSHPDVASFLSWTFAAHQRRVAGGEDPFPSDAVAAALQDLETHQLVRHTPGGFTLTDLGEVVARRNLGVQSVQVVADLLRDVPVSNLNSATLIAIAQVTPELQEARFSYNRTVWRDECEYLVRALRRAQIAPGVLARLRSESGAEQVMSQLKRTLACVCWIRGIPRTDIEQGLSRFLSNEHRRRDIAPIHRTVRRTADIVGAVIDIACRLHPALEVDLVGSTLSAQLQLGVTSQLVPVAHIAGRRVDRLDFCRLIQAGIVDAKGILDADKDLLLTCLRGNRRRLEHLRAAAEKIEAEPSVVDLADLLAEEPE